MGAERADGREGAAVATGAKVATPLHPSRVAGRSLSASLLRSAREALTARGDASGTGRALARRWAISHAVVDRWCDPTSGTSVALGDVLAMPRDLAREVLVRALASLEDASEPSPRRTLAEITMALGRAVEDLERDLVDGRMDEGDKHRAHLCRIGTLALRGLISLGGMP